MASKTRISSSPTKPSRFPTRNFPREPKSTILSQTLPGTPMPDLVECFMASNTIEAKFVADQLMEQGIAAIADKININLVMGGFQPQLWGYGPKVRVRQDDLPKAQAWLKAYEQRRKARKDEQD